jgi:hypothetical protein
MALRLSESVSLKMEDDVEVEEFVSSALRLTEHGVMMAFICRRGSLEAASPPLTFAAAFLLWLFGLLLLLKSPSARMGEGLLFVLLLGLLFTLRTLDLRLEYGVRRTEEK